VDCVVLVKYPRSMSRDCIRRGIPLGAEKWMTLPSDLNMLTSSIWVMGWTFIFFRVAWSFWSSAPEDLWTFF
jgi:hypothetical protein